MEGGRFYYRLHMVSMDQSKPYRYGLKEVCGDVGAGASPRKRKDVQGLVVNRSGPKTVKVKASKVRPVP